MPKVPLEERKLNEEQKKAVCFGNGPLMIIAGAGTGKTTVITERIKYLISSGKAKPQEILALTFTEKASREMEERVDKSMPYGVTQMWISTFHAFCDRILRAEAINVGIDPGYTLMTEAETILFFRKNIFKFDLSYFRPYGNPMKFIAGMIQHFSRLKDEDVSPMEYLRYVQKVKSQKLKVKIESDEIQKLEELAMAYRMYEELKVKEGVCDYSDLISHVLHIFRTRPNILARYASQFAYILIDEFQDTNYAQNELAVLLAGKKKNITVVGDDDQAIYRWRGAAVSNMIQFKKTFPKATIIVLTKNYRSTKEILDRSYHFIQNNNPDRLEIVEKIDKKLESVRRINGEPMGMIFADRVENEADMVAKEIKRQSVNASGRQWSDFAILVRANNHADPFARALGRMGIPYQFLGPGQLFRQPEVKDLIAYLKVLYNFEDNVAVYRVITMEWLDIIPRDIAALSNYAKKYGVSLFESCEVLVAQNPKSKAQNPNQGQMLNFQIRPFVSDETEEKIKSLVAMIHKHLGMIKKETAGQILYFFLEQTGLLQKLAKYASVKEEKIAVNISKFFNKLKTYEVEHEDASVFTVVDWIELSMNLGESPMATDTDWSENNAVNIMTIHSAKGLEFPVVFLVNLVSQRFPTMERKEQIPVPDALVKEILPKGDFHTEEERRLFYVGMTRARDMLYVTAAKFYGEGKREKKLSPFIVETLGEEIVSGTQYHITANDGQLSFLDWEKKDEKENNKIRQKISYLSYSQLSSFTMCPLQYKYRYIVKIPIPASAALTFGDTIHRTVRAFYELVKNKEHPTVQTLLRLLDDHWVSIGYKDKTYESKMKAHGVE
jgi:DNA helicase-2/ATP-dependent DNA helicase PcrA